VPIYEHNLNNIYQELDIKIKNLEAKKIEVEGHLKAGIEISRNTDALKQMIASLAHAKDAQRALYDSCCGQSCNIDYA
jgi:hypothetical protein